MANVIKDKFLKKVEEKFGKPIKLENSLSLFDIGNSTCKLYIRYSKVHSKRQAFYGLRVDDLKQLQASNSVIVFLWDNQDEPLLIPFGEFEDVWSNVAPASDGQIKAQVFLKDGRTELYIAQAGRFNVETFLGWHVLQSLIERSNLEVMPEFNHSQIQTLIGGIGVNRGFDIWIPLVDRSKLDWNLTSPFRMKSEIPDRYNRIADTIKEIDVIWVRKGSSELTALFEVEHSTPVYSGLLRFNDLHLHEPHLRVQYNIVSNELRRSLFLRQINRPTFKMSGLSEICNFMEYRDVYGWFKRAIQKGN
jgi:hypothetical protein